MPSISKRARRSPSKTSPASSKSSATSSATRKQSPKQAAAAAGSSKIATTKKSAATLLTKLKNKPQLPSATKAASSKSPPPPSNNNQLTSSSGIDEVLNEADHLLQAAAEAQALGRLRNASTYLLLAHARLVGLGRRFDRSRIEPTATSSSNVDDTNEKNSDMEGGDAGKSDNEGGKRKSKAGDTGGAGNDSAMAPLIQLGTDQSNMSLTTLPNSSNNPAAGNKSANSNNNISNEPMLFPQTLHHMPDGVAYVEHLARAAMELHHKRTGRGMQHDLMVEKQSALSQAKKDEKEQIRLAARGLFATAKGMTGIRVDAGENSNMSEPKAKPATRKRKQDQTDLEEAEKIAAAKRKGGRGKKPPTLVMHTVAGRNYDVHALMKGEPGP
jgi:hypothetical protein